MNLAKRFKQISATTILSGLLSPAVYAHPGHIAESSVHSLLHIEHIVILVIAAAVALALYTLRSR